MGVDNDHSTPLAHLEKYKFITTPNLQFGSQDDWLVQPQKTLAYVKALQYWVEKAQLLIHSEPHHLAESMIELWWVMEPLITFTDEEVLKDTLPSNWVEISSPQQAEAAQ